MLNGWNLVFQFELVHKVKAYQIRQFLKLAHPFVRFVAFFIWNEPIIGGYLLFLHRFLKGLCYGFL